MSARRLRRTLKPRAQDDVRDALHDTRQQWGADQRRRYRDRLYGVMRQLLDFPELGQARDDLFPGCRGLRAKHHVIFYRIAEDEIVVGRVLHVRQDATGKGQP